MSGVEWTEAEREAVTHLSCVNLDCPGPHDRRHGPNGPKVARRKAEKILDALAPSVAAREAQAWDEGKSTGWSRAMRYMSDEPKVDINPPNPYRIERGES